MDRNLYTAEDFASDESFIHYYLNDNADDILFWQNWISHHPEKLDEIYNAERILDLLYLRLPDDEFAAEFDQLNAFLNENEEVGLERENKRFAGSSKAMILAFCGALICLGLWVSLSVYQRYYPKQIVYSVRHNPYGQRSIFQLSDGSKVTLNANSTLKFPVEFSDEKRNVELEGEAFFEVTKDAKRPFIVQTDRLYTKVLGTKFNVNTEAYNGTIQIALVEGKVKVGEAGKKGEVVLFPFQKITYYKSSQRFAKSKFDEMPEVGWTDGVLSFKNASFMEVAEKIKSTYGITVINSEGKITWDYTGEFKNTDYLTIIKSICYAKNLKYKVLNDTVIIKK